jgi:glutathione S-transferase
VYLEDILFGKANSAQRLEIISFSEVAIRMASEELSQFLNQHLETRMFIVGHSITAADIFSLSHLLQHWVNIKYL